LLFKKYNSIFAPLEEGKECLMSLRGLKSTVNKNKKSSRSHVTEMMSHCKN